MNNFKQLTITKYIKIILLFFKIVIVFAEVHEHEIYDIHNVNRFYILQHSIFVQYHVSKDS